MSRLWVFLGASNAFIAVAAGAFAAHGLRSKLEPQMLAVFETGARYQMYHALAMILVGVLVAERPGTSLAGWGFLAGTVLFSGSLYVLALTGVTKLGMVTPLGGLGFLVGWLLLAVQSLRG